MSTHDGKEVRQSKAGGSAIAKPWLEGFQDTDPTPGILILVSGDGARLFNK